tara:strand:+ start:3923 stop:4138 length:216 start_codon:yes stop_codon:yes gene_type:complete
MSYRKLYEKHINKIPKDWDVHHIDFNHNNNKLENLISIPKVIHKIIHQYGFIPKDEIENLIQIFNENKKLK